MSSPEYENHQRYETRNRIRGMFDAIAFRYDCLNRLLSFRRDVAWRKALVAALPRTANPRILDAATGTGDVLLAMLADASGTARVIGVDVSGEMLRRAQRKIAVAGKREQSALAAMDAAALAFPDSAFDAVSVVFGVRNFADCAAGLAEMWRVLKPGGVALTLEFSLPANPLIRAGYLLYFRVVLPRVAGWLSRQPDAYRYLNTSVEAFPYGEAFCRRLQDAGFSKVTRQELTFGIATLYRAEK